MHATRTDCASGDSRTHDRHPGLAPSRGISRGFIRVDLRDPVFFDHPLDHVPGMLLVVAGLELAEHACDAASRTM